MFHDNIKQKLLKYLSTSYFLMAKKLNIFFEYILNFQSKILFLNMPNNFNAFTITKLLCPKFFIQWIVP